MSQPYGTVPTMDTPRFGPDAILIASSKKAHRPGHNNDTMIRSGKHTGWGGPRKPAPNNGCASTKHICSGPPTAIPHG